jgi:hypothetical protein
MSTQTDELEGLLAGLAERAPHTVSRGDVERRVATRRRRRGIARAGATLVCAVAVVGGVVWIQGRADTPGTPADQPGAAYSFHTPTVSFAADTVSVHVDGSSSSPTHATVHSDSGTPNEYTTLELSWTGSGAEQRLNLYFQSDGTNWWASEIRVYDATTPDWVTPSATGEFFKSPLGTAFTGDLHVPNVDITGLTLQAFLTPTECNPAGTGIALIASYPTIEFGPPNGQNGFAEPFRLVDVATCATLPRAGYSASFTTDDPSIVAIANDQQPPTGPTFFADLQLLSAGTTTLHATVKDSSGAIVATASVPVVVTP